MAGESFLSRPSSECYNKVFIHEGIEYFVTARDKQSFEKAIKDITEKETK